MRILHVVPAAFGPDGAIGGAERYALELVKALRRRADARLVSFGDDSRRLWIDGVPVQVLRGRAVRGHAFNRVGIGVLRPFQWADVVHCHQQHILSTSLLGILGQVTRKPVIVTDHGGGGWDLSQYVSTDPLFSAHLHVSVFSREVSGHAHDRAAEVIYGGVDVQRFTPAAWTGARDRVLFVGRVLPHKGVHDLVAAMPPGLALDVVGPLPDTGYAAKLRALARGKDVVFHGAVDEQRLALTYRNALCLALPSSHQSEHHSFTPVPELLGQVVLEAMASGIPTIATDAGALGEVVSDGITGLTVPQNDPPAIRRALEHVAADWRGAARMGQAGRERAMSHFAWDRIADRCLERYRSALRRA